MKKKLKWIFLITLLSLNVQAENVPLPTSISSVDDIISEFRTQFATKLVDLGKNYISTFNPDSVYFTNSESTTCNNIKSAAGERLAGIQYITKKSTNQLFEKVSYLGCNQETALIEEVTTTGTDLEPLKFTDIIKGKRSFDLKNNETTRYYKIKNESSEEVFSVSIEKKNNIKYLNFSFLGQKFLSMLFEYNPDSTNVVISYYGYSASYVRKFSRWNMRNEFTTFTSRIIAKRGELVMYLDSSGNPVSLSNFIDTFNQTIMDETIQTLSEITEYHTYFFPVTASTKTGNQSQRFIEEVRRAQTRLLTNSEINLVKNMLQDFINAAELGLIIDNRPKVSN